jgi:sec-independent protein translocase protein TatA
VIPNLGVGEIALIAGVVVILFGAKKIPEAARGLGRSLREFKRGLSEPEEKEKKEEEEKEEPTKPDA